MRRELLFILAVIVAAATYADDSERLGFKGSIESAEVSGGREYLTFDNSGNLSRLFLYLGNGESLKSSNISRTTTGFSGSGYTGQDANVPATFNIVVTNNHISKITVNYHGNGYEGTSVTTFSYGVNGFLSKQNFSDTYTQEETIAIEPDYDAYERRAQAALDKARRDIQRRPYDVINNQRRWAIALRKANDIRNQARTTYKTTKRKHSNNTMVTYSGYRTDEYGNWVSRTFYIDESNGRDESCNIRYSARFCWDVVRNSGNLYRIEAFAKTNASSMYGAKARTYWNENILNDVQRRCNNHRDTLLRVAFSPIADDNVKNRALDMARRDYYYNIIDKETDFHRVRDYAKMEFNGNDVFDSEYKKQILDHAKSLQQKQINGLLERANNEMNSNDYEAARQTVDALRNAEGDASVISKMRAKADYGILCKKEKAGNVTKEDYIAFLENNQGSEYQQQVNDKYAAYILARKDQYYAGGNKYGYSSLLEKYSDLDMSPKMRSKYNAALKRSQFAMKHGAFVRIGINGTLAYGGGNILEYGGGLGIRLGYLCNMLNLYVGGEYQAASTHPFLHGYEEQTYVNGSRIVVPVMLRLNFLSDYDFAAYIAGGIEYNIPLKGKLTYDDTELINEKEVMAKAKITPRVAIGIAGQHAEFEVYGVFGDNSVFNKNLNDIYSLQLSNGEEPYKKALESSYSIGATVRINF